MTRITISFHEAGHAVAAAVLGIPVEVASIRPGAAHSGVVVVTPAPDPRLRGAAAAMDLDARPFDQPQALRAAVERQVVYLLAGQAAESLVPHSGFIEPCPLPDPAIALAALPPRHRELLDDAERATELVPDMDQAERWARALVGPHERESQAYLHWLGAVTHRLVHDHADAIARVARALMARDVLTGAEVGDLMADQIRAIAPTHQIPSVASVLSPAAAALVATTTEGD